MSSNRFISRTLATGVAILVMIGLVMSALHYAMPSYNPGFKRYPTATILHIVPGALYLGLAPLQFMRFVREKWIHIHRALGWALSVCAMLVGTTAFFMAMIFPFSGVAESISVGFFASLFLCAIVKGLVKIRAKEVIPHKEWMTRAFALGLGIATSRIIFLPFYFSMANPKQAQVQVLFIASFIAGFSVHLLATELWIRRARRKRRAFESKRS